MTRAAFALAALLACAPVSPPAGAPASASSSPVEPAPADMSSGTAGSTPADMSSGTAGSTSPNMPSGTADFAPPSMSSGPASPAPSDTPPAQASRAPSGTPSDPRAGETGSVYPGINAPYRARGAARTWSRRFERDGREVHDHQAQIVEALALRPGMAVADVGAGTGLFTLAFAAAVGPQGRVHAVDLIPEFLEHIRKKLRKAGVTNVTLVQATDRSAELPPASVDLVFMSDAYHHLEYPQHVLASLRAALRPGGALWVIDFNRDASSDPALRRHVRAGKALVLQELTRAGFDLVADIPLLRENYVLHLRPRP